jgi:excisionase family DNA binding protein
MNEPAQPRRAAESPQQRSAERLMTVDDLAAMCGVPKATVYKWRSTGEGPPGLRLGKHLRFRPRDVEQWLETRQDPI